MKPRSFTYHRPVAIEDALATLDALGEATKILAGGQSLVPMLNFRLAAPEHLVDINRVEGLDKVELSTSGLRIGATVRQRKIEMSEEICRAYPLLGQAMTLIAHPQIRNRGTVCGSLAHADSAAELPTAMVALGAEMVVRSVRGQRIIPAAEFFEFHLVTALESNEILVEVRVPPPDVGGMGTFVEVSRRAGDFALTGAGVQVTFDARGICSDVAVVCCGVGARPARIDEVREIVIGTSLTDDVLRDADYCVRGVIDPPADVHASAAYRRVVAGTLVRRALASLRDAASVRFA